MRAELSTQEIRRFDLIDCDYARFVMHIIDRCTVDYECKLSNSNRVKCERKNLVTDVWQ